METPCDDSRGATDEARRATTGCGGVRYFRLVRSHAVEGRQMRRTSIRGANMTAPAPQDRKAFTRRALLGSVGVIGLGALWARLRLPGIGEAHADGGETFEVTHTDAEWRKLLTPAQYRVLRRGGTEPAFSSPLDREKRPGIYACAGCDLGLYSSDTKFDSGTGWPSFWKPLPHAVNKRVDYSLFGMARDEVHCRRCGGHLGHVFDDGPPPTGLRYCMNGVALKFKPAA
jgi:peptide-methionine (R)-S-oxide reductase